MPNHSLRVKAWWLRFFALPVSAGLLLLAVLGWLDIDLLFSGWLFQLEGGSQNWPLRNGWLTDTVLHTGGRDLVVLMSVALVGMLLASRFYPRIHAYRRGLVYLLCSVTLSVLLVRFGKSATHVYCPWDLTQFGGSHPYVPFPMSLWQSDAAGQCFPGGHSGGAFAWVALYYFAREYFPRWRRVSLALVLFVGLVFGLDQELRGAHFLSHDLTSLLLSWLVATLLYALFWPMRRRDAVPAAQPPV